ncbi:MAG: hypothetical protein WBE30_02220 [Candidatus Cybelea sp.]
MRGFLAVENIDRNAPFGGGPHNGAKRLRDSSAAPNNFAQVLGIHNELDHRLRLLVDEEFHADALGLLYEFAREKT